MAIIKMKTYHIHITGIVQGVGFRPHVYRLAQQMKISGQVSNTPDGVHIFFNASSDGASLFYHTLLEHPPIAARIARHHIGPVQDLPFKAFEIVESQLIGPADLLPAPDISCCDRCRVELADPANRRYRYPFTTCTDCGPRYSIMQHLPYDRPHTTMAPFVMCAACAAEYTNAADRRFYSQTNSCSDCTIPLHLYDSNAKLISSDPGTIYAKIWTALSDGAIVAVKGMGGYLLLCDAYEEAAVRLLRKRKLRQEKPFALLYKDTSAIRRDLDLTDAEAAALVSPAGPIVVARLKKDAAGGRFGEWIAPGLQSLGAMLPCTPLLQLLVSDYGRPLVATSANISGAPILYRDKDALSSLQSLADHILVYERDIVTPQDDSVLQLTDTNMPIVLRRSRGWAPNYFPHSLGPAIVTTIGLGADLKGTFALQENYRLYVSQNLGDQGVLDAQEEYQRCLDHWQRLLEVRVKRILVDAHPGYATTQLGLRMAEELGAELMKVQHHRAHFAAVLAENGWHADSGGAQESHGHDSQRPVLGFIWDGTGYGDDGNIWGSETLLFDNKKMTRIGHLDYFPQLPGDMMSHEPRLSALVLLKDFPDEKKTLLHRLTKLQQQFYASWLLRPGLQTSSMGRLLDGIAYLLGITELNSYEGEAAMKLEHLAMSCSKTEAAAYPITVLGGRYYWQGIIKGVLDDLQQHLNRNEIALKIFHTLVHLIDVVASQHSISVLAFSGGVFQNRLLVELMVRELENKYQLLFHRQLSPNDECIGFGQIAYYFLTT